MSDFIYYLYTHIRFPCMLRELTGYYCPGCGGTRAFFSLLRGDILKSLYYNPIVVYAAVVMLCLLVRVIRFKIVEEDTNRALLPAWVFYMALIIVVANFLIKNLAILLFGVYLL